LACELGELGFFLLGCGQRRRDGVFCLLVFWVFVSGWVDFDGGWVVVWWWCFFFLIFLSFYFNFLGFLN